MERNRFGKIGDLGGRDYTIAQYLYSAQYEHPIEGMFDYERTDEIEEVADVYDSEFGWDAQIKWKKIPHKKVDSIHKADVWWGCV